MNVVGSPRTAPQREPTLDTNTNELGNTLVFTRIVYLLDVDENLHTQICTCCGSSED
jgi:hypothetical protein